MSRIRISFVAVVLVFTAGCTSLYERVGPVEGANQIGVYESVPLGTKPYVAVKRLWTQDWRSAVRVPLYASAEAGVADLRNQAVALGGNAIVNFGCYRLAPDLNSDVICNGTVVRFTE